MRKIFLDTDVIIDFFTDRKPFSESASRIFSLIEIGGIEIYISALSINNVYYIIRKYLGHKKAVMVISELIEVVNVIGTSKQHIVHALAINFKDFEDAVQHSSALSIEGIQAIITRNVKDFSKSKIAVFTAENYLKTIGVDF